jgi:hypothetical protein
MPSNPHDRLVRRTFADLAHARGLLRSVVLAPLSSRIDWASLELLDGTFIDPRLAARQTDLLYGVRTDGSRGG